MPKVAVDWDRCSGEGTCVDVCPVNVFELQEIAEHPETLKAVPVRAENCTLCMECVVKCIELVIKVEAE